MTDSIDTKALQSLAERFRLRQNEPMKQHTSFRVGGPADLFACPGDSDRMGALLSEARDRNIPVTLIGGGTNLLVSDRGIRGLVICTKNMASAVRILDRDPSLPSTGQARVKADAGIRLASVCRFAAKRGLSGLEFAAGIPGTIGGAVAMNAGTPERTLGQVVEQVTVIHDADFKARQIPASQIRFAYRSASVPGLITAVILTLEWDSAARVQEKTDRNRERKQATQPVNRSSAGCFFKNPTPDKPAGMLIDQAGLKGLSVNDAQVSHTHANYIINRGTASCADILALKQKIQEKVNKTFGIILETEVRIEGE